MPQLSHVVVLAFENRSFDHMLGFSPPGGRLTGAESNPVDPADPNSERVTVNQMATPITGVDPNHSFEGVREQMYGVSLGQPDPAPMNGFVSNYTRDVGGDVARGKTIMNCHSPATLPVLAGLAQHYSVCTRWFSSVPGPTWPNRFYMHAATSRGLVTNEPLGEGVPTIFDRLDAQHHPWRVYAGDVPQCLSIESLAARFGLEHLPLAQQHHFAPLAEFFNDLQGGSLPAYSFIEPQYFDTPFGHASDQHPPHDIQFGEVLLAHVYNSLVASPAWDSSVLLVLFDEHGGFFDSIPPPSGVPAPDDHVSTQPSFNFTRLGVRVPAVVVSAWVDPGVDATQYDHASIPATINAVFNLGAANFLTRRDAAARPFSAGLKRTTPRPPSTVFKADTSSSPTLAEIAPPEVHVHGTRQALETVLYEKSKVALATLSTHQRQLLQLSQSVLNRLT